MKKNISRTMNHLNIDDEIRGLIKQLWKHNYKTLFSCSGHGVSKKYVIIDELTGDGWFTDNASKYRLTKQKNSDCCNSRHKLDNACGNCGAGINGKSVYSSFQFFS